MQNLRFAKLVPGLFTLSTLKQLFVMLIAIGMGLMFMSYIPEAGAQFIDPTIDNPQNIEIATAGELSVRALAVTIINFFLFFLGLVATIMVIYGGVLYVTAGGNDDQVGKAKNVILYSIVGIVVILLSFALVNTILAGAGTGDVTATQSTSGN